MTETSDCEFIESLKSEQCKVLSSDRTTEDKLKDHNTLEQIIKRAESTQGDEQKTCY